VISSVGKRIFIKALKPCDNLRLIRIAA